MTSESGDWLKEDGGFKEHVSVTHEHGQWCGDGLWELGAVLVDMGKGENWNNCNTINKIFKLNFL